MDKKLTKQDDNFIKRIAYDALIEFQISELPVTLELNSSYVSLLPMQALNQPAIYPDMSPFFKCYGEYGFSCYLRKYDCFYIFYNNELPETLIRWTIASALSSIELDALQDNLFSVVSEKNATQETFAMYFTCPDPVLKACNFQNTEDILQHCQIPFRQGRRKSLSLRKTLFPFNFSITEKRLLKQFSDYIHNNSHCKDENSV